MNEIKHAIVNQWPSETMIDLVAHNGEAQEPTYKIGLTLYRINPVGNYALYWNGKKWQESATVTNAAVRLNGSLQK